MEEKDRILNRDFWQFVSDKGVEFRTLDKNGYLTLNNASKYMSAIKVSAKTARKKCRGSNIPPIISIRFLKGGATETWNGQVLCQPCNSKKGASLPN